MGRSIGVLATRHIWVGNRGGRRHSATVRMYPEPGQEQIDLKSRPRRRDHRPDPRADRALREGRHGGVGGRRLPRHRPQRHHRGIAQPGQLKGLDIGAQLCAALRADGIDVPVTVMNDADALAAGIAATHGVLEKLIRVWYLGDGIGFGRYPQSDGVWEGGHMVVTLDPKERYCGCGGVGHLEGIMGNRAMRLRFLDMEPEEVFAAARHGDTRGGEFVNCWHRALAAATATSVHLDGPGRFYLAGPNADFVDLNLLSMLPSGHGQDEPAAGDATSRSSPPATTWR